MFAPFVNNGNCLCSVGNECFLPYPPASMQSNCSIIHEGKFQCILISSSVFDVLSLMQPPLTLRCYTVNAQHHKQQNGCSRHPLEGVAVNSQKIPRLSSSRHFRLNSLMGQHTGKALHMEIMPSWLTLLRFGKDFGWACKTFHQRPRKEENFTESVKVYMHACLYGNNGIRQPALAMREKSYKHWIICHRTLYK